MSVGATGSLRKPIAPAADSAVAAALSGSGDSKHQNSGAANGAAAKPNSAALAAAGPGAAGASGAPAAAGAGVAAGAGGAGGKAKAAAFRIREGRKEDAQALLDLIRALAVYEKADATKDVSVTRQQLEVDGWGPNPVFRVLFGEVPGAAQPVAFALYFTAYSTWTGRCIYLEDIFVQPEHRHSGLGLALVRRIVTEAHTTNAARVMWQVLSWNKLAMGFYDKIGAAVMTEWVPVRMDRTAIAKFLATDMGKS